MSACEARLGYRFADRGLLQAALTHASSAQHRLASNERLEFLGDAILGAVVCELLFQQFPEYQEGDLTKLKSVVVSRKTCAKVCRSLGLEEYLILGKGVTAQQHVPVSLLANAFESLIAAIYLDGGQAAVRGFVERALSSEIVAEAAAGTHGNFKSVLQQLAQRELGGTPVYLLLDEKGPDHSKCFQMSAQIGATRFTPAWGRNKKEAEQRAAWNALCELRGEPAPCTGE